METFLSKFLNVLGWLFLPLWLAFAVVTIRVGIREAMISHFQGFVGKRF